MKVCGQLEKAQLEHLSSDPSGDNLYQGRVWFNTTSDNLKCYDGSSIKELTPSIYSVVTDYIIPDASGYSFVEVTDTTATRTVTLPTVADNKGRIIEIVNTSTQKGKVTVDGEGSETINGFATIDLDCKYSRIKIVSTGSQWIVLDSFFNDKTHILTVSGYGGAYGWTTSHARGLANRGLDGIWYLDFVITGSTSSTYSDIALTIADITVGAADQAISGSPLQSAATAVEMQLADVTYNRLRIGFSAVRDNWLASGRIQLASKPVFLE